MPTHLIPALRRHEAMLGALLAGVADADLHRGVPRPGGETNSIAWIIAHLARTRGSMLAVLGHGEPAEPWEDAVARGAKREPKPVDAATALSVFRRRGARLVEVLPSMPAETWAKPFPRPLPDGSATNGPAFDFLAFHEAFHLGQIDLIKVGLGLAGIA